MSCLNSSNLASMSLSNFLVRVTAPTSSLCLDRAAMSDLERPVASLAPSQSALPAPRGRPSLPAAEARGPPCSRPPNRGDVNGELLLVAEKGALPRLLPDPASGAEGPSEPATFGPLTSSRSRASTPLPRGGVVLRAACTARSAVSTSCMVCRCSTSCTA